MTSDGRRPEAANYQNRRALAQAARMPDEDIGNRIAFFVLGLGVAVALMAGSIVTALF